MKLCPGVKLSCLGVKLSCPGVKLSCPGVKLSCPGVKLCPGDEGVVSVRLWYPKGWLRRAKGVVLPKGVKSSYERPYPKGLDSQVVL